MYFTKVLLKIFKNILHAFFSCRKLVHVSQKIKKNKKLPKLRCVHLMCSTCMYMYLG